MRSTVHFKQGTPPPVGVIHPASMLTIRLLRIAEEVLVAQDEQKHLVTCQPSGDAKQASSRRALGTPFNRRNRPRMSLRVVFWPVP